MVFIQSYSSRPFLSEKVKALPPIVNFDKVYPLLDTYDNFKDYTDILQPLMHLELWESVR